MIIWASRGAWKVLGRVSKLKAVRNGGYCGFKQRKQWFDEE
jgi:hypothetical protein